jgi:predicted ATPase
MAFDRKTLPPELLQALRRKHLIPFVGAGFSMSAGLPDWSKLLRQMATWCKQKRIGEHLLADVRHQVAKGKLIEAAGILRKEMEDPEFFRFLQQTFRRPGLEPAENHRLLVTIDFPFYLTTNYDGLIEGAYAAEKGRLLRMFTWQDTAVLANALADETPYLLKMHGDLDRPESIIAGQGDYREILFNGSAFEAYFAGLLQTNSLLFLGYGLEDLDFDLRFDKFHHVFKGYGREHYALVSSDKSNAAERRRYREWNISVIGYEKSAPHHPEVTEFLRVLRSATRAQSGQRPRHPARGIACDSTTKPSEGLPPSAKAPSNNLPRALTSFVGREQEVAELQQRLMQGPLVTLTGVGGCGKTRLAVQTAAGLLERFPDGISFVDLALGPDPVARPDVDHVATMISRKLGLPEAADTPILERLKAYLANREMLLLLDNFEHVIEVAPLVTDLLMAAPRLKVMVTSRTILRLRGEQAFDLSPLDTPDPKLLPSLETVSRYPAVTLFVDRARSVRDEFVLTSENALAVAELCRRLDGLPLAIELAAARIRLFGAPQALLARFEDWWRLLTCGPRDLPERQQTLRATIDWSYELLSEGEKELFQQLSVFAGTFTLEATEAVHLATSGMPAEFLDRLSSLIDQSLVRVAHQGQGGTRYSILGTVREYGLERLRESDAYPDIAHAHAQYYLRFAQKRLKKLRSSEEVPAFREIESEYDNLHAALERSRGADPNEQFAELALALGVYLQRRGFPHEAGRYIDAGLGAVRDSPSEHAQLRGKILRERASIAEDLHEWQVAREMIREALSLASASKEPCYVGDLLNLLGAAAYGEQEYLQARIHLIGALRQLSGADCQAIRASALNNLGLVECYDPDGDKSGAARYWEEVLVLRQKMGDSRGRAETLVNLGILAQIQKQWDDAWSLYGEALRIERELDHTTGIGRGLCNLGEVAWEEGRGKRVELACRLFAASERLFEEIGSPLWTHAADQLVTATRVRSDPEGALKAFRQAARQPSLAELSAWALTGTALS